MSPATSPARSRARRAAASASVRAPLLRQRWGGSATATDSMTVATAGLQSFVDREQYDPDLEPRCQRQEGDPVAGMQPPRVELFDERHDVGGRGGVAVAVDGDDQRVPGFATKDLVHHPL